jgi:hypothetical protein
MTKRSDSIHRRPARLALLAPACYARHERAWWRAWAAENAERILFCFPLRGPAKVHRRKLKDHRCRFNGGSGFCLHPDLAGPAAIFTIGIKTIRGWKAAPTIHNLFHLIKRNWE